MQAVMVTSKHGSGAAHLTDMGHTVADPGGGSKGFGPPPPPPIRPDACLGLKFLNRQDRISLFNWLIFLMTARCIFPPN